MTAPGQNVWYDCMTPDTETAARFYTEVIGWKTQLWEDGDPNNPYTMWMVGERAVGGLMTLPEEAQKMGAPPHWLAYTTVNDVDATTALADKLGGKVLRPAFDIPKVGRIGILADPQGAAFAVFAPAGEMPPGDRSKHGEFSWSELNTTDYESAWNFYSELFGWKHTSSMDMGPGGTYFMFQDASEVTKGGMSNVAQQMGAPPHWLHYVTVDDLDATLERVTQNGGKILNGPMDIPGDDRIAQCCDSTGAAFAVYCKGGGK